jgi:hypothetical protein
MGGIQIFTEYTVSSSVLKTCFFWEVLQVTFLSGNNTIVLFVFNNTALNAVAFTVWLIPQNFPWWGMQDSNLQKY